MKYLIVNADDFGASAGINRGILEAHERGVLTSTSLMVNMPAVGEAVRSRRDYPELSNWLADYREIARVGQTVIYRRHALLASRGADDRFSSSALRRAETETKKKFCTIGACGEAALCHNAALPHAE